MTSKSPVCKLKSTTNPARNLIVQFLIFNFSIPCSLYPVADNVKAHCMIDCSALAYQRSNMYMHIQTIASICCVDAQILGSRVGVVVRALAFHQCVPGSIPGPGVICGLSLLVLYSALRGFSPGTPIFPSPQKPTFDLI